MTNENIELARHMDFDRLDALVSERIGELSLYAQSLGTADAAVHAAICRDLLLPLRRFYDWRRGGDIDKPGPLAVGEVIDVAVEMIEQLESAKSEVLEQARLNGMGGERELALMVKLEAAEKARDNAITTAIGVALRADALQAEIDNIKEVQFDLNGLWPMPLAGTTCRANQGQKKGRGRAMTYAILFSILACALAIYFGAETIADAILGAKRGAP